VFTGLALVLGIVQPTWATLPLALALLAPQRAAQRT
jgi:hypothetical protein